jgi:oligoribonuclease NrnB/cAMP/cGMP phosphodiesterase (DHH superfamily)
MLFKFIKFIKSLFKRKSSPKIFNEYIVIAHDDIDGTISAALIKRKYKDIYFIPSVPREVIFDLGRLNIENKKIFISDLSPNDDLLNELDKNLSKLIKNNNDIIWIDHHTWSKEAIDITSKYSKLFVERTKSAAELVAKVLELNDEISLKLVEIANDADTASYSLEDTININRALRYKARINYIIDLLSEGKIKDEKILKWAKKEAKDEEKIKEIINTLPVFYTKSGQRYTIIDIRKARLPGSLIAKYASIEKNLDFTIVIYPRLNVSFYAGMNKDINLLPVAKKYNGGGHPFACGCLPKLSFKSKLLTKIFKGYIPKEIKEVINTVNESI